MIPRRAPLKADFVPAICYQDDDVLIVDKPCDLKIDGADSQTLEKFVLRNLITSNGEKLDVFRPVNQLDSATSGCIVIGKTRVGANKFSRLFDHSRSPQDHPTKLYLSIVDIRPRVHPEVLTPGAQFSVVAPIAEREDDDFEMCVDMERGRFAFTSVHVVCLSEYQSIPVALVCCRIHTGRRHQIRLHLKLAGMPIVGDMTYGVDVECPEPWLHSRMMLHSWLTMFESLRISSEAEIPEEWRQLVGSDELDTFVRNVKSTVLI